MSKNADMAERGRVGGRSWRLTTPEAARKKLTKLLTEFHRERGRDTQRFRAEVYALSVILQYFNHERENEIEARLSRLEREAGIDRKT